MKTKWEQTSKGSCNLHHPYLFQGYQSKKMAQAVLLLSALHSGVPARILVEMPDNLIEEDSREIFSAPLWKCKDRP
jgi:hypothetical protein